MNLVYQIGPSCFPFGVSYVVYQTMLPTIIPVRQEWDHTWEMELPALGE